MKSRTFKIANCDLEESPRRPREIPAVCLTEHGAIQAANVLNSPRAVTMGIHVVRAFVQLRDLLATSKELVQKFTELERKLAIHVRPSRQAITGILIQKLMSPTASKLAVSASPQTSTKNDVRGFREELRTRHVQSWFAALVEQEKVTPRNEGKPAWMVRTASDHSAQVRTQRGMPRWKALGLDTQLESSPTTHRSHDWS